MLVRVRGKDVRRSVSLDNFGGTTGVFKWDEREQPCLVMFQRTRSSEAVWKAVLIIRAVSVVGLAREAEGSSPSEMCSRSCIEPCHEQKVAQFGLGGCFG